MVLLSVEVVAGAVVVIVVLVVAVWCTTTDCVLGLSVVVLVSVLVRSGAVTVEVVVCVSGGAMVAVDVSLSTALVSPPEVVVEELVSVAAEAINLAWPDRVACDTAAAIRAPTDEAPVAPVTPLRAEPAVAANDGAPPEPQAMIARTAVDATSRHRRREVRGAAWHLVPRREVIGLF